MNIFDLPVVARPKRKDWMRLIVSGANGAEYVKQPRFELIVEQREQTKLSWTERELSAREEALCPALFKWRPPVVAMASSSRSPTCCTCWAAFLRLSSLTLNSGSSYPRHFHIEATRCNREKQSPTQASLLFEHNAGIQSLESVTQTVPVHVVSGEGEGHEEE